MTMTDTVGYRPNDWWTIDDLFELPVLTLENGEYAVEVVVPAGKQWHAEHPFPLTLDPAEFC
jgi:hypothetical protein